MFRVEGDNSCEAPALGAMKKLHKAMAEIPTGEFPQTYALGRQEGLQRQFDCTSQ